MNTAQFALQIGPQTTLFINPEVLTDFFQKASSAQRWTAQAQLNQLTPFNREERRLSPIARVKNLVLNAWSNPRVQGSLQVLGGVAEISAGYGMTFASGLIAAPIGHVAIVHGMDHFTTGLFGIITGKNKNTVTQTVLITAGVPPEIAGSVDAGLSIVGVGMGAKTAAQLAIFPQYKLPPPYLNDSYNRVAFEELKVVLRAKMKKPYVVNAELRKYIDEIYRTDASIGSGSTAAAIREELATREMIRGTFHSQKGRDRIVCLEKWLKTNPTASLGDRAAAENMIKDMKDALGE
jgi:hypothetical protein